MTSLWNKFWGTAVLLPLSFLLSTIFNVRRTEDSSYALWSALLLRLCDVKLDIFIICPQYALYVSPKAKFRPNDSISSTLTEADSQAKGVVVDNCLIMPEIRLAPPPDGKGPSLTEYLANFFNARPSFSEVDVRTTNATVPIIAEQKRPPSRHPRNIYTYHHQIHNLLDKAISQAWSQGTCLFSMPKFARQNHVMLIGASGAWWRFCLMPRPKTKDMVFDIDRYGEGFSGRPDEEDDEEDEEDEDDEEDNGFDLLTSPDKAIEVRTKYEEEERSNKERTERRKRRERLRDESWEFSDAKRRLGKFIDTVGEGPYTLAELDKCSELVQETHGLPPAPISHQFDDNLRVDDPRLAEWTKPMRLGTPISDKYMTFIKNILADLAEKEVSRRKGEGAD